MFYKSGMQTESDPRRVWTDPTPIFDLLLKNYDEPTEILNTMVQFNVSSNYLLN